MIRKDNLDVVLLEDLKQGRPFAFGIKEVDIAAVKIRGFSPAALTAQFSLLERRNAGLGQSPPLIHAEKQLHKMSEERRTHKKVHKICRLGRSGTKKPHIFQERLRKRDAPFLDIYLFRENAKPGYIRSGRTFDAAGFAVDAEIEDLLDGRVTEKFFVQLPGDDGFKDRGLGARGSELLRQIDVYRADGPAKAACVASLYLLPYLLRVEYGLCIYIFNIRIIDQVVGDPLIFAYLFPRIQNALGIEYILYPDKYIVKRAELFFEIRDPQDPVAVFRCRRSSERDDHPVKIVGYIVDLCEVRLILHIHERADVHIPVAGMPIDARLDAVFLEQGVSADYEFVEVFRRDYRILDERDRPSPTFYPVHDRHCRAPHAPDTVLLIFGLGDVHARYKLSLIQKPSLHGVYLLVEGKRVILFEFNKEYPLRPFLQEIPELRLRLKRESDKRLVHELDRRG